MRWRSSSPASLVKCCTWSAWASTMTSSTWVGTRCSPRRWCRGCARRSEWSCRWGTSSPRPRWSGSPCASRRCVGRKPHVRDFRRSCPCRAQGPCRCPSRSSACGSWISSSPAARFTTCPASWCSMARWTPPRWSRHSGPWCDVTKRCAPRSHPKVARRSSGSTRVGRSRCAPSTWRPSRRTSVKPRPGGRRRWRPRGPSTWARVRSCAPCCCGWRHGVTGCCSRCTTSCPTDGPLASSRGSWARCTALSLPVIRTAFPPCPSSTPTSRSGSASGCTGTCSRRSWTGGGDSSRRRPRRWSFPPTSPGHSPRRSRARPFPWRCHQRCPRP
ncbi:hypothetical protein COSO111634_20835 [Corallococcus soli]